MEVDVRIMLLQRCLACPTTNRGWCAQFMYALVRCVRSKPGWLIPIGLEESDLLFYGVAAHPIAQRTQSEWR
jgi:hypothetical protein